MKKYYTITLESWMGDEQVKVISETQPMTKTQYVANTLKVAKNYVTLGSDKGIHERIYGHSYNMETNDKIKSMRIK